MNIEDWLIQLEHTRCQEAHISGAMIGDRPIECGQPGTMVVFHKHDGQNVYVMCDACGSHNIKNRRGIELVPKEPK